MKLLERADAYMNMGDLDQNQQRVTPDSGIGDVRPEDYGYTEEMSKTNKEIGFLRAMVAQGILGWITGEKGLELVMNNDILSDETKGYISNYVKKPDDSEENISNDVEIGSGDNTDSSDIEPENMNLQEELKRKIKANFDRFLI
jgi:hypothetical protein